MTDYTSWNTGYKAAQLAAQETGHVSRHTHAFHLGVDTGRWIARQLENFNHEKLSKERKDLLRQLPGGSPDQIAHHQWEENWPKLRTALTRHGVQMPSSIPASKHFQQIMEGIDPFSKACQHLCFAVAGFEGDASEEQQWMTHLSLAIRTEDYKWLSQQVTLADEFKLHEWRRRALVNHVPRSLMNEVRWHERFEMLQTYIRTTGQAVPAADYIHEGESIGEFAQQMRKLVNTGKLPAHHQEALASLPGWSDEAAKPAHVSTRTLCTMFVEAMDAGRFDPQGLSAKNIVSEARLAMNADTLPQRQQLILASTPGFSWVQRTRDLTEHAKAVSRIIERDGLFRCHPWVVSDGMHIGSWWGQLQNPESQKLIAQHVDFNKTEAALRGQGLWDYLFGVLADWVDSHEGKLPGIEVVAQQVPLGAWLWTVNYLSTLGMLAPKHQQALREATEYCAWTESYGQVCAAYEAGSPRALEAPARRWVAQVRRWYFLGVKNQQVELLGQVPGFTWGTEASKLFKERAALLADLASRTDGGVKALESTAFADGFSPAGFITTQRQRYLNPGLPGWQADLLERIPGWRWANEAMSRRKPKTEEWLTMLSEWQCEYGPFIPERTVIFKGEMLGGWVETMKQRRITNALPSKLIDRLEAVPGWSWEPTAPHVLAHGL